MCDFIALTWCCKLISFLHLIFAVLLANLKTDVLARVVLKSVRSYVKKLWGHVTQVMPLLGKIIRAPKTKLCIKFEVSCSMCFDDMVDRLPEILSVT